MDKTTAAHWGLVDHNVKEAFNKGFDRGIVIPCTREGVRRAHVELSFKYDLKEVTKKGAKDKFRASYDMEVVTFDYLLNGGLDHRIEPLYLGRRTPRASLQEVLEYLNKIFSSDKPEKKTNTQFIRFVKVLMMGPRDEISLEELASLMEKSYKQPLGTAHQSIPEGKVPRKYILPLGITPWSGAGIRICPVPYPYTKDNKTLWRYRVIVKAIWSPLNRFDLTRVKIFYSDERPELINKIICQLKEEADETIRKRSSSGSGNADELPDKTGISSVIRQSTSDEDLS